MEKKRNWFGRHIFLTIILAIFLVSIIMGMIDGMKSGIEGDESSENQEETLEINAMDKTSGFTMDDCYEICDQYPMQIHIGICERNCDMYGKESIQLDNFCLASIESVKNSQ
jgi:hypothetical protein